VVTDMSIREYVGKFYIFFVTIVPDRTQWSVLVYDINRLKKWHDGC
jgi:hypothetical protein